MDAARRDVERDTGDDLEAQSREANASVVEGAWLKNVAEDVADEIAGIGAGVTDLGLAGDVADIALLNPTADARFDALGVLVQRLLHEGKAWSDDERIVIFTEYKTTLDYITRRLRERYDSGRILTLYGRMDELQ